MSSSTKLSRDVASVEVDPTLYRSMISSLLYLTMSRPDIVFSVGVCARFQTAPKESHLTVVKWIIRYINGTFDYEIWHSGDLNECLAGYSDADWVGCIDDRKSTSNGCFYLGNNLVSWMSKKAKFSLSINGWSWVHCSSKLLCTIIMDEEAFTWLWNYSRHYVCVLW